VVMAYLQAGLKDKFTQVNILFEVNPIFPLYNSILFRDPSSFHFPLSLTYVYIYYRPDHDLSTKSDTFFVEIHSSLNLLRVHASKY
jgi:hypothetical protein